MINKGNLKLALEELKNNDNNAVSHLYKDCKINKGNLKGLVITIKDLYATKDAPTCASSKILKGFMSGYDATIISKLKKAGASIVAKVNLDELGLGGTGTFSCDGPIKNTINELRMVGGSSSGSVVTMTKNIGASIGSDTGDSVRLPASYFGLVGFKPSYGAISRFGMFTYASSLDTVAYFNHNISDSIELSRVLYGLDELDMTSKDVELPVVELVKPKSVGFILNDKSFENYHKEEYSKLKQNLIKDNVKIKEFKLDSNLLELLDIVYQIISFSEAYSNDSNLNGISFGNYQEGQNWDEIMQNTRSKCLGINVQKRLTLGSYFLMNKNIDDLFIRAQKIRRLIVDEFNKIKKQVDVIVFPATTISPLLSEGKVNSLLNSYLIHANLSGTPSISIPWSKYKNMPFNLSIDGLIYKDKKLLSHSLYFEKLIKDNKIGEKNE